MTDEVDAFIEKLWREGVIVGQGEDNFWIRGKGYAVSREHIAAILHRMKEE